MVRMGKHMSQPATTAHLTQVEDGLNERIDGPGEQLVPIPDGFANGEAAPPLGSRFRGNDG